MENKTDYITKPKRNSELHKGHRQRLKSKVLAGGLKSLSVHEVLELCLTYTIPLKDTNELAHKLLNSFSSFAGVLDSSVEELMLQKGVGKETALFLTMLPQLFELYQKSKAQPKIHIGNIKEFVSYFRTNFIKSEKEKAYLFFVDEESFLQNSVELESGESLFEAKIFKNELIKILSQCKTKYVILCHTHPNGDCYPSEADISATGMFVDICNILGVYVLDHIIVNHCEAYSMKQSGLLIGISNNVRKMANGGYNTKEFVNSSKQYETLNGKYSK